MKLSPEDLRAIANLRHVPEFQVLMEAMAQYAEELTKTLVMRELDSGQLYQKKGEARAVVSILEAITKAPQTLDNIETHRDE